MYGPLIQGKLVRLRPPRPEEADVIIRWFEDQDVTRFLEFRFPPGIEFEKEWLDKMARDPNQIYWLVGHEGGAVGGKGVHGKDWEHGIGPTGTGGGDKTALGQGRGSGRL